MSKKTDSLTDAMEVRNERIVLTIDWSVVHEVVFYGLLVAITLLLAVDGTLLRTVLEQLLLTALAVYLAKGHL